MVNNFSDYITDKELDIIFEKKTPGQAAQHHAEESKKKDPKKKADNLIKQLGYEYSFVFMFAPAIKGLYPIIEHLIIKMDFPQELSKASIVYLTICIMGILLNEPKSKYKNILKRVKDEGLYKLIKPLITSLKGMKRVFTFISRRVGKVVHSFAEMFAYTALFVPFAMTFSDIIQQSETSIMGILEALANNGVGKLLSTSVGVGAFAVKHFMEDIVTGLKSFRDKGVSAIKKVIDKIKSIDFRSIFPKNKPQVQPQPARVEDDYPDYQTPPSINYLDSMFNERKVIKFSEFK